MSLLGEADFHIVQVSGDHVAAARADASDVEVSGDGGRTFEARSAPGVPVDVAFDPRDPARMAVATAQGIFTSADEGRSWRPRGPAAAQQLAWVAPDALFRADAGGRISVSADGGASWTERGTAAPSVNELAVGAGGALLASAPGGAVRRSTDGGASGGRT